MFGGCRGKNFGFVAFVVRSFFVRLELSRADELCGLRRCPNPTGLSRRVKLSLTCVDVSIQPVGVLFSFSFFFISGYDLPGT